MSDLTDITDFNASELSERIHQRQVSCTEVMQAYLKRIERLNPRFNAIVNLAPTDSLLAQARQCDAELAKGQTRGWLHGIPQAIKDTGHAVGFPTTFGSTLLQAALPAKDSIMTERMKAAGAIVIGKTNMPELGLGSHTFNTLFGPTPNAWDSTVSAGGSSGGAAVALAQRLLPVADGSDFMGSLRNPASWNHVFGMRPSQGRVPFGPGADLWVDQLGTEGPMARSVRDLARLLATQSGHDARQPLSINGSIDPSGLQYTSDALRGLRVGWLGDLNGHLAMEDGILDVCQDALQDMAGQGARPATVAECSRPAQSRSLVGAREFAQALVHGFHAGQPDAQRFLPASAGHVRPIRRAGYARGAGLALCLATALAASHWRAPYGHLPPLDGMHHLRHAGGAARHQSARGLSPDTRLAHGRAVDRQTARRSGFAAGGCRLRVGARRLAAAPPRLKPKPSQAGASRAGRLAAHRAP
jgi:Asp-tRNA(Asn)/Glu-tRNA(Gln) amidotransferase A subunit family amidase